MGTSGAYHRPFTCPRYSVFLKEDSASANVLFAKTDAGLEVHQRLGPYIRASALTARMKLSTRIVNTIYVVRDYSPITTCLAMVLLPLVLIPVWEVDDIFNSIAAKHGPYLVLSRSLFLAAHLARSFHNYLTYRHLDLSLVANIHSQELWSAPWKSMFFLIPHTQSQSRGTATPAILRATPSFPTFFLVPHNIATEIQESLTKFQKRLCLPLRSLPHVPPPPWTQNPTTPKLRRLRHHSLPHKRTLRPAPRPASLAPHSNRYDLVYPLRDLRGQSAILSPFSGLAVSISKLVTQAASMCRRRQQAYQLYDLAADGAGVG